MITDYHTKYYAGGKSVNRIGQSLFNAFVELNPLQGDNNIANLKNTEETWKVRIVEPEFKSRMFEKE